MAKEWHGWLHHTYDELPIQNPLPKQVWEEEHLANQTGTLEAYRPAGSQFAKESAPRRDYEAWSPE